MEKIFIGVDISKDTFDYFTVNENFEELGKLGVVENNRKAIKAFIKSLNELGKKNLWICMEHTGHYGALLVQELTFASIQFSLINPIEIKRSLGLVRGKTDAIDAKRIAFYGATHKYKLTPYSLPTEALRKLKALMTTRDRYAKILVQLKNGVKANKLLNKTVDVQKAIDSDTLMIQMTTKLKAQKEKEMLEIIKESQDLKKTYDKIIKVIGVGPITAIKCITETQNFSRFIEPRKFCCHTGIAPFEYSSGTSVKGKTKTNHFRDKALKSILFKAASSAIQHDPQLKAYYNRKVKEGKHKMTVLNAVSSKLVLRIFAVAKRNEPFVKLAA